MNKYIFPGADASTPLAFVVGSLESAGFEIKHIDTCGLVNNHYPIIRKLTDPGGGFRVHYSATLWRWYRNWVANRDKVVAKYGERWFRVSKGCSDTFPA